MKEKKDPTILKDFLSPSHSSLFLRCNPCFFFAYKRKSRASHGRDGPIEDRFDPTPNRSDLDTHKSSNRALSTLLLLSLETWDLSLSRLFVTPTINFQCY